MNNVINTRICYCISNSDSNNCYSFRDIIQKTLLTSHMYQAKTIRRDLDKLKMLNLIDREGGRKEGSWIIVKDVVKDVVKDEQIKKQ